MSNGNPTPSLEECVLQLLEMLRQSSNIVFLGGAGVSTESGIPDFRSESGIFKAVQEYGYPPETLLSAPFFHQNTQTFYDYYRKYLIYPDASPNRAHRALARLERAGKLKAVVTQNIDGLHQAAGSKLVYELHGSIHRNTCLGCGKHFPLEAIRSSAGIPRCDVCGGIIKPDVVLYGENLDDLTLRGSILRISGADMLLIGGTSLLVYPAAGLSDYFAGSRLCVINMSETRCDGRASLVVPYPIGQALGSAVDRLLGPESRA